MKAPFSGRISPAKAALFVAVIMLAWPVFLFFRPQAEDQESPPPRSSVVPPSKLRAVGLAENSDWEDMPGFFAVWADKLEWKNDRTQFAYWNPGSNSYSYFFEAIRGGEKIRFRALSRKDALDMREFQDDGSGAYWRTDLVSSPEQIKAFEFRENTPTHPFLFFKEVGRHSALLSPDKVTVPVPDVPEKPTLKLDDPGKK